MEPPLFPHDTNHVEKHEENNVSVPLLKEKQGIVTAAAATVTPTTITPTPPTTTNNNNNNNNNNHDTRTKKRNYNNDNDMHDNDTHDNDMHDNDMHDSPNNHTTTNKKYKTNHDNDNHDMEERIGQDASDDNISTFRRPRRVIRRPPRLIDEMPWTTRTTKKSTKIIFKGETHDEDDDNDYDEDDDNNKEDEEAATALIVSSLVGKYTLKNPSVTDVVVNGRIHVAKYFDDVLYFGTVTQYKEPTKHDEIPLWKIIYDDGDSEDFDFNELQQGLGLYKKEMKTILMMKQEKKQKKQKRRNKKKVQASSSLSSSSSSDDGLDWWKRPSPSLWDIHKCDPKASSKCISKFVPKGMKSCCEEIGHFFLFCYERQLMWERYKQQQQQKEKNNNDEDDKEQPVTSHNNALSTMSFCNNYRELDRGTRYFHSEMLDLWDTQTTSTTTGNDSDEQRKEWMKQVLWASTCYRIVNKIETFMKLGGIPTVDEWKSWSKRLKKLSQTQTVFTGATQNPGVNRYIDAIRYLYRHLTKMTDKLFQYSTKSQDLQRCFEVIYEIPNVGKFFAWQITCDLLEHQCLTPCTDNDWVELGPGAKNGIDIIFACKSHTIASTYTNLDLTRELERIQDDVYDALDLSFPKLNGKHLSLKVIEHALCEFTKYHALQKPLSKKKRPKSCRFRKSRSHMDSTTHKICWNAKKSVANNNNNKTNKEQKSTPCCSSTTNNGDGLIVCDFCLNAYCLQCVEEPTTSWFQCTRCQVMDSIQWL